MIKIVLFVGSILSRAANAVFFRGSMHQTLSARAHIEAREDPAWARFERRIDWLARPFEARHCEVSWREEVARARSVVAREEASREPDFMRF